MQKKIYTYILWHKPHLEEHEQGRLGTGIIIRGNFRKFSVFIGAVCGILYVQIKMNPMQICYCLWRDGCVGELDVDLGLV